MELLLLVIAFCAFGLLFYIFNPQEGEAWHEKIIPISILIFLTGIAVLGIIAQNNNNKAMDELKDKHIQEIKERCNERYQNEIHHIDVYVADSLIRFVPE